MVCDQTLQDACPLLNYLLWSIKVIVVSKDLFRALFSESMSNFSHLIFINPSCFVDLLQYWSVYFQYLRLGTRYLPADIRITGQPHPASHPSHLCSQPSSEWTNRPLLGLPPLEPSTSWCTSGKTQSSVSCSEGQLSSPRARACVAIRFAQLLTSH